MLRALKWALNVVFPRHAKSIKSKIFEHYVWHPSTLCRPEVSASPCECTKCCLQHGVWKHFPGEDPDPPPPPPSPLVLEYNPRAGLLLDRHCRGQRPWSWNAWRHFSGPAPPSIMWRRKESQDTARTAQDAKLTLAHERKKREQLWRSCVFVGRSKTK